jgi:general secretion pathway protein D
MAVLSNQPDHPPAAFAEAGSKRNFSCLEAGSMQDSGPSVRGHLERVARMQRNRIGSAGKTGGVGLQGRNTLCREETITFRRSAKPRLLGLLMLAGAFVVPSVHAQTAGGWNNKGMSAEAREDYDAAFEAFRQAHLKKPKDLRYKTRYERLKFEAANMHVDRGRVLRQSGDLNGATNEFARALQIDPGNQAAAQELQVLQSSPGPGAGAAADNGGSAVARPTSGKVLIPGVDEQTPYQQQVQKDIASMGGPVVLQAVSNDPITLHMLEDTKVIYQSIGKAAGLNVIFDPDYTSKRIPVDLTSVSLPDALRIVGTLSGTFWKPVTSNTIFVAQNNRTKRTDLDDLAVQTFYLTNVSQQNDANEVLVALRNLLDPSVKIYLVASQNAIIVRATPDELILAEKLINDLDRTRPEVVIDVAVLEVSRQLERNLGITLPTSFGLTPQSSNANSTASTTGTTATTTQTTTTATSGITLNTLGNLNATNFAVLISGGTVNALLSDAQTRVLQNPRIRATDGQRATLKIGSKIPVATGSYSAGAAVTTASLGVQTQFTYLDVGVNIDVTPTVHYDREISLKLKIEVSSQNGSVTISNVTEPIIAQKVSEQVIQLKDGEPSILAGLVQQQKTDNKNGTPGLGELPFLKYFFSSTDKTTQSDELVFLLIPHIIRESVLTDENTRKIYTGTSQSIELLHRDPPKMLADNAKSLNAGPNPGLTPELHNTSAANAASAMLGKMAADTRPAAPVPAATVAPPPAPVNPGMSATPVTLRVLPGVQNQTVGSTFQVAIVASNAHDLYSVPMQMQFDPKLLALVNVDAGDLLARDGQAVALVHRDEGNGAVTVSASRPPGAKGVDGQGTVCTLTFKSLAPGDATLALTRTGAKDSQQNTLPTVGMQGVVHVK